MTDCENKFHNKKMARRLYNGRLYEEMSFNMSLIMRRKGQRRCKSKATRALLPLRTCNIYSTECYEKRPESGGQKHAGRRMRNPRCLRQKLRDPCLFAP